MVFVIESYLPNYPATVAWTLVSAASRLMPRNAAEPNGEDLKKLTNKLKHVPQEAEARMAYGAALDRFSRLVEQFGEATVMGWISAGLPPAAMQALATK